HAPEVLCVRVPADAADLPAFVAHLWPTDTGAATEEDRGRHDFYRAERERGALAAREQDLGAYLEKLAVEVSLQPLAAEGDAFERAAQLTARTTQLNINGRPLSAPELERLVRRPDGAGWVVAAKDRYGDYGVVGLVIACAEPGADSLIVEQFLLSCRALGRGVEHRMMVHLGQVARSRGRSRLVFRARRTLRNAPALDLLAGCGEVLPDSEVVIST